MDRRLVLSLLAAMTALPLSTAIGSAEGPSPRAIVTRLYDLRAAQAGDSPPLWEVPTVRSELFSPDLLGAFDALAVWQTNNPDEVPPLDGDPFYDAQDWDITDLEIGDAKMTIADTCELEVTFKNFGEQRRLRYTLVTTADGWRIDDIDYGYGEGGYTLRDLLSPE